MFKDEFANKESHNETKGVFKKKIQLHVCKDSQVFIQGNEAEFMTEDL